MQTEKGTVCYSSQKRTNKCFKKEKNRRHKKFVLVPNLRSSDPRISKTSFLIVVRHVIMLMFLPILESANTKVTRAVVNQFYVVLFKSIFRCVFIYIQHHGNSFNTSITKAQLRTGSRLTTTKFLFFN